VQQAGRNVGKIFISSSLGPSALAYYAVGSYLLPIIRALRSGITDAIYPELVRAHEDTSAAVRLWQRVNVLNCVMFFPAFAVLVFYATEIISIMFTDAYLAAVPIFMVLAFFLIRRCFNTDILLRTTGRTGFMLWGTVGALIANMLLIAPLSRRFGLVGPAIAFLASEVGLELYYAHRSRKALGLSIAQLADWRNIGRIAGSCICAMPILLLLEMVHAPDIARVLVGASLYCAAVLLLAYRLGVADIGRVAGFAWAKLRRLVA
jgi:O-antigen/teichoic acid export membrane protein